MQEFFVLIFSSIDYQKYLPSSNEKFMTQTKIRGSFKKTFSFTLKKKRSMLHEATVHPTTPVIANFAT